MLGSHLGGDDVVHLRREGTEGVMVAEAHSQSPSRVGKQKAGRALVKTEVGVTPKAHPQCPTSAI